MTHGTAAVAALCAAISSGALASEHWVLVVDADPAFSSSRAAVMAEVKGRMEKWTDATELAAGVRFRNFMAPDFRRAPPPGWPDALREAWTQGASACQDRMGDLIGRNDPSFAGKVVDGNDCAEKLESALWNRWLRAVGATRVVKVSVNATRSGDADIFASTYAPDDPQEVTADQRAVASAKVDAEVRRLVAEVLGGRGATRPRGTSIELPAPMQAEVSELNATAVHTDFAAVPPPAACKALPAKLAIDPGGSNFAKTLAARWEASARGSGEPLSCRLSSTVGEAGGLLPTRTLIVNLKCGSTSHRGEAALMKLQKEPWDIVTATLIKSIYASECAR